MREHSFTPVIRRILTEKYGDIADLLLQQSELLQYLNIKTISADRGSKSRGSFANLYAVYVLVEDYVQRGFHLSGEYSISTGAKFSDLLTRQRQLPFGSKLQNHALNHRMNKEFEKYFPTTNYIPILRDPETRQYWFNENLLGFSISGKTVNIAESVLAIINAYVNAKVGAFNSFIADCERMQTISGSNRDEVTEFLQSLLRPNVDARIFEIVSFAILKVAYSDDSIFWGWEPDNITEEFLTLYKTGRTNANDGGIDFVMRPLGRFFQVTETLDVRKYFLDIDKLQKYPVTFVIKSELPIDEIEKQLREQAEAQYVVQQIVDRYMASIEEIINIPELMRRLKMVTTFGDLNVIIDEIIKHSRVEFDFQE